MAKTLGTLLREKRESRYLSLPEAEIGTHIKAEYLRALEEERFEDLPGPTYTEIYLREYGRFLDLDSDTLLHLFQRSTRWSRFWQQLGKSVRTPRGKSFLVPALLVVMVLALIAGIFWIRALIADRQTPAPPPAVEKNLTLLYPPDRAPVGEEVTLVGQIPPGAYLAVDGEEVPTEADGSFVYTVALPEGDSSVRLRAWDDEGWEQELRRTFSRATPTPLPTATPRPTLALPAHSDERSEHQVVLHQIDTAHYPEVVAYFSVFDREGNPWPALTSENLTVTESDLPIEEFFLTSVPVTEPLAIALAVDVSGSMAGEPLTQAQEALRAFLANLNETDAAALVSFDQNVSLVRDFTQDKDSLAAAVDTLRAAGDTALYDAVLFAVERVAAQPYGRRAVVVLTDGLDTASSAGLEATIARAALLNVPVYTLGLQSPDFDEGPMRQLAEETGALYLLAPEASALQGLYEQLNQQFQGQFEVIYRSPEGEGERRLTLTTQLNGVIRESSKSYQVP